MDKHQHLYKALQQQKVLPLFYHDDTDTCISICQALYDAGIRCVEFTNRGPQALQNFKRLAQQRQRTMPQLLLGIGTIRSAEEVDAFVAVGADFLISPFFDARVLAAAQQQKCLWIPGAMTPTEIHLAQTAGCHLIKLFPGNTLQPGFVEAVRPLFRELSFIVTGGVEPTSGSIASWLHSGAIAVGLGSRLITKELIEAGSFHLLAENTRRLLTAVGATLYPATAACKV